MGSKWTTQENKLFEDALAFYDRDTHDRWHNISRVVGTKTAEEVKGHYQNLVDDIEAIESGWVPLPKYKIIEATSEDKLIKVDEVTPKSSSEEYQIIGFFSSFQ